MKKTFLLVLVALMAFTAVHSYGQNADGAAKKIQAVKKAGVAEKIKIEDLEGLTEEQILALLKGLEIDDIMLYLRMVLKSGSRELMANMIGALNAYIATLDPQAAVALAQRAASENPELSYGIGKNGKPVVFVTAVNNAMNEAINKSQEQQSDIDTEKTVVSGASSN